jgi:hypothetical protein
MPNESVAIEYTVNGIYLLFFHCAQTPQNDFPQQGALNVLA